MGYLAAHSSPFLPSSSCIYQAPRGLPLLPLFSLPTTTNCPRRRRSRATTTLRASSSSAGDGSARFTWEAFYDSVRRGSARFASTFGERLAKESGLGLDGAKATDLVERARGAAEKVKTALGRFRSGLVPQFLEWNKWGQWKVLLSLSRQTNQ